MYAAKAYIGQMAAPGEILPESIPEETIKWLMEAGAIREIAPDTPPRSVALAEPNGGEQEDGAGKDEQDAQQEPEEPDEDEEAPEIDVMAGIVTGTAEEKTTEKRTTGRRKSK